MTAITVVRHTSFSVLLLLLDLPYFVEDPPISVQYTVFEISEAIG